MQWLPRTSSDVKVFAQIVGILIAGLLVAIGGLIWEIQQLNSPNGLSNAEIAAAINGVQNTLILVMGWRIGALHRAANGREHHADSR